MVTAGTLTACLSSDNCTSRIQADSAEFITFNNSSTIQSLPDNGVRLTVPTPTTQNTSYVTFTAYATTAVIFTSIIPLILYSHLTDTATAQSDRSAKFPIIIGTVSGAGGFFLGAVLAAMSRFVMLRHRSKPNKSEARGLRISAPMGHNVRLSWRPHHRISRVTSSGSLAPVESDSSNSPPDDPLEVSRTTPEWRGRWTGATRYQEASDEDVAKHGASRRIATLDLRNVP